MEEKKDNFFVDTIKFAIIAFVIVLPFRIFIAQPFLVSGSSMDPTFQDGNYLIVDQISYRFNDPKRDDVIILRYPNDTKTFFIKRIIGLPSETLEIKNNEVFVKNKEYPDGLKLEEKFINKTTIGNVIITLKDDEYFVMGDNRDNSSDSRIWGPLRRDLIVGKPVLRLFPFSQIGLFPGKTETTQQD